MVACGVTLVHLVAFGVAPSTYVDLVWSEPLVGIAGSVVLFWVLFAVAITPEQRRDTRASVSPFRSGVAVVQVTHVHCPHGLEAPPRAPEGAVRADGLPEVVAGELTEEQERHRDGDGWDE